MAKVKQLAHNAKLIGFDIDDGKYGIMLPYFITDIFHNDLQSHKTNHSSYSKKVIKQLEKLEKNCKKYCDNGNQQQLLNDLERFAKKLRERIISWDKAWLLRDTSVNNALRDRTKSYIQAGLMQPS